MKGFCKKILAAALSGLLALSAPAFPAVAVTVAANEQQEQIAITFPVTEKERTVVGTGGITITGRAKAGEKITARVNGKFGGTAAVSADGTFELTVSSVFLPDGRNDIVLSSDSGESTSLTVKKQKYYDLADIDCTVTGAEEHYKNTGVSKYCPLLSVGGQTVKTDKGISLKPAAGNSGDSADAVYDISGMLPSPTYFHSIVGVDDFANIGGFVKATVIFTLLADGREIVRSKEMTLNQTAVLAAEIPAGTSKLVLRVENSDGKNQGDYGDFINPRLFLKKSDFGGSEQKLFAENDEGNTSYDVNTNLGVRLNLNNEFSAVTVYPEKAVGTVNMRLYKFTYSYTRSMQNGILYESSVSAGSDGGYRFELNDLYSAGEYLMVFGGIESIKANASSYGVMTVDKKTVKGIPNMAVTFSCSSVKNLNDPTAEPKKGTTAGVATDAEKQRAKKTYEEYITNLEKFPSKITIGEDTYTGFSHKDFTVMEKTTSDNEVTKSKNTDISIIHGKTGTVFTLKTVFYPDYAAFDWVVYFTNSASRNTPVIKDVSPAELTFEGDNPIILTSCGDTEADTQTPAPFTPRSYELEKTKNAEFKPSNGRSTEVGFPYYNFEYGNKGAFVVTGWPGQWITNFNYENGVTTFSGRQETFNSYLKPGETARTPLTAVILYDGRDTDRARSLWRNWFIDCNMFKKDGKTNLEPFIAGLPSEVMYSTEDSMKSQLGQYISAGVNIDYWWIDAGWYIDGREKTWVYVGNWTVDTDRFPTKLKSITEACEQAGMTGGMILWFEPERNAFGLSGGDFERFGVKKEWLVGYDKKTNSAIGPSDYHIFDLGNKEALEWVTNKITTVINDAGVSIYREDFNNGYTLRIWNQYNQQNPDRAGMIENGEAQGHLALWDSILKIDTVKMIDSCASGGHRLDLETMRRAVALHPTDYNYNDMAAKHIGTYGLAEWFPFMGANTGFAEYHSYTSRYILRSAYRQSIACQVSMGSLTAAQKQLVADSEKEWRGISKYFYDDVYELTKNTAGANEWYAYGYIDSDEQNGFALVFKRSDAAPETQVIRLKGLNYNDTYEITFADSDAKVSGTGAQLMYNGVSVTLNEVEQRGGCDSDIIYIKRTAVGPNDDDDEDDIVYGDVDANGTVEATDALWALQAYVGSRQLDDTAFKAADVNLDKEVNTSDALAILQYAVKLRDKLPIA